MSIITIFPDGRKLVKLEVKGPTSYLTGGFSVRVGELVTIETVAINVRTSLRITNFVHKISYSYAKNTITVVVHRIDVTAAAPSAWAEVPSGTDISALLLEIHVIGL